jgi:light-regulated signal transduction histidine kinase (bacteriophytochrome)
MTKKNYDSGFCGSLPLAFINQIQSYGFLVVTDRDLRIIQVSDNIGEFLLSGADELLGKVLPELVKKEFQDELRKKIALGQVKAHTVVVLGQSKQPGTSYVTVIHTREDHYIFEFELAGEKQENFFDVYEQVREATTAIDKAGSFKETLVTAASELKRISGFDKVMIYKFDEDWNGHVLAEAKEPGMAAYLNLHFPASDIPRQARELYLKNPYRQIPDKNYTPAKLYPVINPIVSGFLDLSDCNMRAVPKVHIEYLGNMQVVASMSTRIIKDNQLWGLISCHHRSAKFLTYQECSVFEILSGIVSAKLSSMEIKDDSSYHYGQQQVLAAIMENVFSEASLSKGLAKTAKSVMELLNCDGFVYSIGDSIKTFGECPDPAPVEKLLIWLQTRSLSQVFYTASLAEHFDEAGQMNQLASGIIAMPVVPDNREFLVAFRKEVPHEINWGGNPEEAIRFETDRNTYHPRNSFNQWQEQIKNTSRPFTRNEIFFANELQRILLGFRVAQISRN